MNWRNGSRQQLRDSVLVDTSVVFGEGTCKALGGHKINDPCSGGIYLFVCPYILRVSPLEVTTFDEGITLIDLLLANVVCCT